MKLSKTTLQSLTRQPVRIAVMFLASLGLAFLATLALGSVHASNLGKFGIAEYSRISKFLEKIAPQNYVSKPLPAKASVWGATISLGTDPIMPLMPQGTTNANLPFTATMGNLNEYSIDYDLTANMAGLVDVTNASLAASPIPFTVRVFSCPGLFTVNATGDASDAMPGDGICATSGNVCTLRAALEEANALTTCSPLTINFSVTGTIDLGSALPDLNHPNLTLNNGADPAQLTVRRNAAGNFRIFTIASGRTVTINGLTMRDGNMGASGFGGGLYNNNGTLTLNDCVVANNIAGVSGAGIGIFSGTTTINRSTIADNTLESGTSTLVNGAGMYINQGTVTLNATTFSGNRKNDAFPTSIQGAGLVLNSATVTATNCTFSKNTGRQVIGNFATSQANSLTLLNCTISNNTLNSTGVTFGAVETLGNNAVATATTIVKNTIVASNPGNGTAFRTFATNSTLTSQGHNLCGDATLTPTASGDLTNTNPLLAALGNYGGLTQTLALLPGSPAINAGTASGAPVTDQRGKQRVGNVDIGAVEAQGFTLAVGSGTPQTTFANTAFASPLSVTVTAQDANDPVNGGRVTFTPPGSGASATLTGNPATIANGLATTGIVTANTLVGGPYNITANANGAAPAITFALTNICPTITVTNPATTTGTAFSAFSQTFTQTGGIGTTVFSTTSTLPTGLTLSSAGVLSGTPTQTGTFPLTVIAQDSNGCTGNGTTYNLVINCQTITVNPPATTSGTVFSSFSQTFTQSGGIGTTTFSTSSTLPTGLTLASSGLLSGTPAQTGTFPLIVKATDSNGCMGTSSAYNLVINAAACINTLTVNTVGDGADATPGDSVCETAAGNGLCTLRAALQEANVLTNCTPFTISFSVTLPNTILLGSDLPMIAHPNLTITGPGANQLTVNGASLYRPFNIGMGNYAVTLAGLTVANGRGDGGGGLINLSTGLVNLNNLTFDSNRISGSSGGGAIRHVSSGTLNVMGSTFNNNNSTGTGGGAINNFSNGTVNVTNGTFTGNLANLGGGIHTQSTGTTNVTNCTLVGNSGGIRNNSGIVTVKNTLAVGNGTDISGTVTASNNLTGALASALLSALGNYGGPTPTFALLPGSPALNAGTASGAPATDQRGVARPQGADIDIGAFESQGFTLAVSSGNNQSAVVSTSFANPLSVTVTATNNEPVNGGQVSFTVPGSGPSATLTGNPATISSGTASTGVVTANSIPGSYNVSAQANGAASAVSFALSNTCQIITVNPVSLAGSGTTGAPFSQAFTQTGGSGALSWTLLGNAPPGLSFTAVNATLSGTPTQAGSFSFTIRATDANGCFGERMYTLGVNCATVTVSPTNATLPGGTAGSAYTQNFTAAGGGAPYSFSLSAGSLPAGLSLSSAGTLAGTPTVFGLFNFTVSATDANGCLGERAYNLRICPILTFTPASLPAGTTGTAYQQTITAADGTAPYTLAVSGGALPPGLNLNASGALSGTPTQAGSFSFTVTATDANECAGAKAYTVSINCPTVTLPLASLVNGFVGTAYNQTLSATGGTAPYTFSVSAGTLPGGLTLAAGGGLSGTPMTQATFTFTVRATDANGCAGERSYTVIISGNGLLFYPLAAPVRLLDTRAGATACTQPNAPIAGQTALTQAGRNLCGIPANAVALTGNLTTVNSGGGFLTLYPSNAAQPTVASTNYAPNEIINNVFTVGLGTDGAFKLFAFNTTEVVVDVTGYYAPPVTGGLFFHPLPKPIRLLETRAGQTGCTTPGTPLQGGEAGTLTQQARITCDGVKIPSGALAIVGNATTVTPQDNGFLTLYPGNAARPLAASSNYGPGQTVNGPFTVGLAPNGEFKLFSFATTELVVDVLGYYSTEVTDANGAGLLLSPLPNPVRLLETRTGQPVGCFKPGVPLNGQQEYMQAARGVCEGVTIPANALGVVGNATAVQPDGPGFLTLWPSAAGRPLVATANYNSGDISNRHFIVGLGNTDGAFKLYSFATSHLVIDLSGYFAP